MDIIAKLTELFSSFPGIGPRQARRFVYFLLRQDNAYTKKFIDSVNELSDTVKRCDSCYRFFIGAKCGLCDDRSREGDKLMIVEKDVDLDNVCKTNKFMGQFFVLGGLIAPLEKTPEDAIRLRELRDRLDSDRNIREVILALSANALGDNTVEFLTVQISKYPNIQISILGRGLSTGTELEYSDAATLSAALDNRRNLNL